MKENKKVPKIKLLEVIEAVLVAVMISKAFMMQPKISENNKKIETLQNELEYEKMRAEEVEELQSKVNTDEYIEKVAREKLELVKGNEKIFIDVSLQ